MEQRFGLTSVLHDRDFVAAKKRERGYGVNAWTTHNRFVVSHALLRDETYAGPLCDWLGDFASGSLLILDEAHHAAPASGPRYAVDSNFTRAVRELAERFEHRLFLSATPHNDHSNSFAALLEMLDPQRFCRGVPVKSKKALETVMVRRLKRDLRELAAEFPRRDAVKVTLDGLPEDAPELALSRLLHEYRRVRQERLKDASPSRQAAAMLVVTCLQKRLLSSIEAFASTLEVHRKAMDKTAAAPPAAPVDDPEDAWGLLFETPGADDDRAALTEDEVRAEEDAQMAAATRDSLDDAGAARGELELLDAMEEITRKARHQPDARVRYLVSWIREHLCPELGRRGAAWNERRVLIFTEYVDTKRYLEEQLETAIAGSERDGERIATYRGGMDERQREAVKTAFNLDPARHPLRILIATGAAREGVNLQNHCADLFHFDLPWNPSRVEQRNGRIDRKLQRAPVVRCHNFILPRQSEDRVLEVLTEKTERIRDELGSLTPVFEDRLGRLLRSGLGHERVAELARRIERFDGTTAPGTGRGKPSCLQGAQLHSLGQLTKRRANDEILCDSCAARPHTTATQCFHRRPREI